MRSERGLTVFEVQPRKTEYHGLVRFAQAGQIHVIPVKGWQMQRLQQRPEQALQRANDAFVRAAQQENV